VIIWSETQAGGRAKGTLSRHCRMDLPGVQCAAALRTDTQQKCFGSPEHWLQAFLRLGFGSLLLVLCRGCPRRSRNGASWGDWCFGCGFWMAGGERCPGCPGRGAPLCNRACLTAPLSPRMPLLEGKFLLGARKTATRSWKGSHHPRRETTGSMG